VPKEKKKWERIDGPPWVQGESFQSVQVYRQGGKIKVVQDRVTDHVMGLRLQTGDGVQMIILDRGVYSDWTFQGRTGKDVLRFGPTGTIINKRRGGVVVFNSKGTTPAGSKFVFENKIDVARVQEKHPGVKIHPLNHLQKVIIKGAKPGDQAVLQGKRFRLEDADGSGALSGVPIDRLKVT